MPEVAIGGLVDGFTGLTEAVTQYLANTAGTISATAGTNSRKIGRTLP